MRFRLATLLLGLVAAVPVWAATPITGRILDTTGGLLPGATVLLRDVATGEERTVESGSDGRFAVEAPAAGTYLLIVRLPGFSEAARTIVVDGTESALDVSVQLEVGVVSTQVSVTANRAERETRGIPLHVEGISRAAVEQANTLSTGDALATVANITPVGNGPFGVRPRLRGLDSTRLLVLVDGERLNTARQATDRTGAETGLISPDAISRIEIVNGAGTLLYGSDALAGTINIITNEPTFTPATRWIYGVNGFYSSNENGRRGTATVGVTALRYAFRVQAGLEAFDNYKAGAFDVEDTRPFFATGQLRRTDTVDSAFGFDFRAFPDPFNEPYVRTDRTIQGSGANGDFLNLSGLVKVGERRSLRIRYQRRRMDGIGFPDFTPPIFFNATSLPTSDLDRASIRYEAQAVTPWLANLSLTAHYQRTARQLQNLLPVQFPVPSAGAFFPVSVMRLDVLSLTEQRVWSPGFDLQAVLLPARNHVLTTGLTYYRDRSSDRRTTTTTTSMIGQVALGARGPGAVVFPRPVQLGAPVVAFPVRVPDASFQDLAAFAQDEWRFLPNVSLVAGLRADLYDVTTKPTAGYDIASVVAGARPPIDPATLPDPSGATYARRALTGDVGLVANAAGRVRPFARYGRSYRHPNLEEMLYAGPATAGNIAPNAKVRPETGHNVDVGAKLNLPRLSGGAYVFVNQYQNFIVQDLAIAQTASGPLTQATNYADVRISGLELQADSPLNLLDGVLTLSGSAALTRGTITSGTNPLDGTPLANAPADNITPSRVVLSVRFTEPHGRMWVEYGVRAQTKVTRITPTLLASPFVVAQDLLSLDGFAVQRLGWGLGLTRGRERLGLTLAIENLTDRYYREQFQFAPSRGRTFTVGISTGAF